MSLLACTLHHWAAMPYMCLCMDPGYFTLVKRTSYHPCPLTIAQLYMSHLSHLFAVKVINNRCAWVPLDLASRHENLIMCADEIKQYREGRVYVWSVIVSLGYAHMCGRFLTLQSKVWQVEIGRTGSISWINVDTAHAITALVISWDALLLLSSSLMKMQSLLVRLIVYTGRLNASARNSMEQRKWEHVCVSMVVVVVVGGLMWCSGGMRGREPLQVENFIQFKHSISIIDPLQRGGNVRREDKEIRWIHLNMLWKCTRLTDIELYEAEMALLIRWKWYLVCAYSSQRMWELFFFCLGCIFLVCSVVAWKTVA